MIEEALRDRGSAIPAQPRPFPYDGYPAATNIKRQEPLDEYEYIVVGSGAGGGPLAARLATYGHKVLLIDAGDDEGSSLQQTVPGLQLQSTEYEPMRWDYYVNHYSDLARQEKDSKMTYRTSSGDLYVGLSPPAGSTPLGILYPRSGTLGGCTAHNALISIYPHASDWTNIQTITGDDSWAPENMRTYFERLERSMYLPNGVVGHGFSGWLGTSLTDLRLVVVDSKLQSLILAAATAMGKGIGAVVSTLTGLGQVLVRDINADTPDRDAAEGLYQVPLATSDYKRNGPRNFVLDTANAVNADGTRKYQLDIKLNTLVTRAIFSIDSDTPQAVGVEYLEGKSLYRADSRATNGTNQGTPGSVNATRELILAAGSFNTPQLLKLSGIGPAAELQKFQIPVLVDLPGVGTNMQDRYEVSVIGSAPTPFAITKDCTFLESSPDPCLTQWQIDPDYKGAYGTGGVAIAIVKRSSTADTDPDLLISGAPADFKGYFPGYSTYAITDAQHWSWITLKAHSRNHAGTVQLRSSDPRDTPLINFNSFDTGTTTDGADQKDLQAVVEGMQFSRTIYSDLVPLDGSFSETWPSGNTTGQDALEEFARNEAWGHHASCTCPIGAEGDEMAVLDSGFRVRGVKGLRVVDASVFPSIPGFYIAVPIYMVSEKAADVIHGDAVG